MTSDRCVSPEHAPRSLTDALDVMVSPMMLNEEGAIWVSEGFVMTSTSVLSSLTLRKLSVIQRCFTWQYSCSKNVPRMKVIYV